MTCKKLVVVAVATAATFSALPSFAQEASRTPQTYGTVLKRGTTVNQAQERQFNAPGVTNELSPGAKESATGGPSGGLGRGGASGG